MPNAAFLEIYNSYFDGRHTYTATIEEVTSTDGNSKIAGLSNEHGPIQGGLPVSFDFGDSLVIEYSNDDGQKLGVQVKARLGNRGTEVATCLIGIQKIDGKALVDFKEVTGKNCWTAEPCRSDESAVVRVVI